MANLKDTRKELLECAKPVMEFVKKHYHSHVRVVIDCDTAEVVEGLVMARDEKKGEPDG